MEMVHAKVEKGYNLPKTSDCLELYISMVLLVGRSITSLTIDATAIIL